MLFLKVISLSDHDQTKLIEYLVADEWVDGKFLPKGTMLFVNVWGLHHDEAKFPSSDTFDPDRYLDRPLLAAEYANSADFENRDHYGYGKLLSFSAKMFF